MNNVHIKHHPPETIQRQGISGRTREIRGKHAPKHKLQLLLYFFLANTHFRAFTANDAVNEVGTRAGDGICEMEGKS